MLSFTVLTKVSFRMFLFPTSNYKKIVTLEMLDVLNLKIMVLGLSSSRASVF